MKKEIEIIAGAIGGSLVSIFGGWDVFIKVLILFMLFDELTGVAAAYYGKSREGYISSQVFRKGIIKKLCTLVLIAVAEGCDVLLGTDYIRNAVTTAFCASEGLSILENTGALGIPYPKKLKDAIEILRKDNGKEK